MGIGCMRCPGLGWAALLCAVALPSWPAQPAGPAEFDRRGEEPVTLYSARSLLPLTSKVQWESRAESVRDQILISGGLWPVPGKTPLNAKVFDRRTFEGFTVEKVLFESWPGFTVGGNLYRPAGREGRRPAVLTPHGHWVNGRLHAAEEASVIGRCIDFARAGMVAFAYDMAGYNDTIQVAHDSGQDSAAQLWNFGLLGLQTWNSIRALDFLIGLPDVDPARVGAAGAEAGGFQVMVLGAVDHRIAAQVLVCSLAHRMQGACPCENGPGLRVAFSNLELAAAAAPRPQLLVGASEDWSRTTFEMEGPEVAKVYALFRSERTFAATVMEGPTNFNFASRRTVLEWFARWLGADSPDGMELSSVPDGLTGDSLRALASDEAARAPSEAGIRAAWVRAREEQLSRLEPRDWPGLENLKTVLGAAWRHVTQIELPSGFWTESDSEHLRGNVMVRPITFGRTGGEDRMRGQLWIPQKDSERLVVILTDPAGVAAFLDAEGAPGGFAQRLLAAGHSVIAIDTFAQTGEPKAPARRYFENYFTTYNRTEAQEIVQDMVTACAVARGERKGRKTVLYGSGRFGLLALLAAPAADGLIADCAGVAVEDNDELLAPDLFVPGIRLLGGFPGAAALLAPKPSLLHSSAGRFPQALPRAAYSAAREPVRFICTDSGITEDLAMEWLKGMER